MYVNTTYMSMRNMYNSRVWGYVGGGGMWGVGVCEGWGYVGGGGM